MTSCWNEPWDNGPAKVPSPVARWLTRPLRPAFQRPGEPSGICGVAGRGEHDHVDQEPAVSEPDQRPIVQRPRAAEAELDRGDGSRRGGQVSPAAQRQRS